MEASGVPSHYLTMWTDLTPATHEQVGLAKVVPDEIVQMLTASEPPTRLEAVAGYMANGCTSPVLYPLGDVYATIDAFAWDSNS